MRRVPQLAGGPVDGARRADDRAVQVVVADARFRECAVHGLGHQLRRPSGDLRVDGVGLDPAGADDGAGDVGNLGADAGVADRERGDVRGRRLDLVQRRVGPGAAADSAGGADQARGLETVQQLGGGGLGQPGQLADPGPGQRAVRDEQIERGPVVHRPQHPGCAR
jgi:hypothetical protein